jgi:hypothetical protein
VSPAASAKGSPTLRLVSPQKIAVCDTHFFFLPRPLPCLWETSKCSSVCPTTRSLPAATIISVQAGQRVTSLSGVLGQCAALAHLELYGNKIEAVGAGSFAGALWQCTSLLAQARQFRQQLHRIRHVRDSSSFVTSPVVKPAVIFLGTLHCLLFAICLADRQQERATYCTHMQHTVWCLRPSTFALS